MEGAGRKKVVIVGGGPCGLLLAAYLLQRGEKYEVELYEGRRDPRDLHKNNGNYAAFWPFDSRGFLIILSLRARSALSLVPGLSEAVSGRGTPMTRAVRHEGRKRRGVVGWVSGWVSGWVNPKERKLPAAANLVSHASLSSAILDHIDNMLGAKDRFAAHFNARCVDVDGREHVATFNVTGEDGSVTTRTARYDLLVGCDGARSTVRNRVFEKQPGFEFELKQMERHWYAFTVPKKLMPEDARDDGTMSVWMGGGKQDKVQIMALPMRGENTRLLLASSTNPCTITDSGALKSASALKQYIKEEFPDFDGRIPDIELENITTQNPGKALKVRCNYYHDVEAKTLIMGDAAHAVFPSAGQGANGAMLDVKAFNDVLEEVGDDLDRALPLFSQRQVPEGRALWHLSPSELFPSNPLRTCYILLVRRVRELLCRYLPKSIVWPDVRTMLSATLTPYSKVVEVYGPMDW